MFISLKMNKSDFEENDETTLYLLLYRHCLSYPRTDSFHVFVHSRNQKRFHISLSFSRRLLRRPVISRISLLPNQMTSFRQNFHSAIDHAMVTSTGFTYDVFCDLLKLFAPVFEVFTPYDRSHKVRKLDCRSFKKYIRPVDGLGLQIFYLRNRGVQWVLCTVFGMTQSQVSNYLRYFRRILI